MSKPPSTWKAIEARIAAWFGLKRRGADYGDRSGGKTDAVNIDGTESEIWALEIKYGKQLGYGKLLDACRQVEAAAREGQEPVVVAKLANAKFEDSLVVQRLSTFRDWRLKMSESEIRPLQKPEPPHSLDCTEGGSDE